MKYIEFNLQNDSAFIIKYKTIIFAENCWINNFWESSDCISAYLSILSIVTTDALVQKAPGHQYLQNWLNIHCFGSVSHENLSFIMNDIRKWNDSLRVNTRGNQMETNVRTSHLMQYACKIKINIIHHEWLITALVNSNSMNAIYHYRKLVRDHIINFPKA